MEKSLLTLEELIEKVDQMKKEDKMDLSSDQDLTVALMNLISIEEHFFFTGVKTGKDKYFQMLNEIRSIRKDLLKKIIKDYEGEVWCISKHLLAASMRLMEVGTKQLTIGKNEEAKELFEKAYALYCLFWGVNMNIIDTNQVQQIDDQSINKNDPAPSGFLGKLGELIKRAIDCCIE